jgi:tRNA-dihydrouridine synthase
MQSFWHDLPRPFFILAPMEAVTDVVFRHVVEQAGAPDLYFSEFTNATGWVHAGEKAIGGRLIKTDDETRLIAQLWGSIPEDMAKLAAHCKGLGFIGIDINMGCPDASAVKAGGGIALCHTPELAADMITAAKTAGLPVSVKTRLGYSRTDEYREWLTHLFRQDIENLTIHLRTKKEMSKVPAHFELIPEIVKLRDEIAPNTLLTVNGDIEDKNHGLKIIAKNPGVNGVMIGRGIFHNPYCFDRSSVSPTKYSQAASRPLSVEHPSAANGAADASENLLANDSTVLGKPLAISSDKTSAARVSDGAYPTETRSEAVLSDDGGEKASRKEDLLKLLHYHLDLYDQYSHITQRPFDTLKRFFKIYVRDFEGAAEMRDKLMHTKSTDEVRALLQ